VTTTSEVDVRCAVCGTLSRQRRIDSTSAFGPPDLDLRPNGPARWALPFRVQRCRSCGYCWHSLGEAPLGAADTVASEAYVGVLERSRMPRLARMFFCAALVAEGAEDRESAGWRFAEAAWACDDAGAEQQARTCRERAAESFRSALEWGEHDAGAAVGNALVADLLRRARRFDSSLVACDDAEHALAGREDEDAESTGQVIAFIRGLCEAGDDHAHHVAEAFAPDE
jgi:hypothetical protein